MNRLISRWAEAPESYDPGLRFDQETGQALIPPWISPYITAAAHLREHHERDNDDDGHPDLVP